MDRVVNTGKFSMKVQNKFALKHSTKYFKLFNDRLEIFRDDQSSVREPPKHIIKPNREVVIETITQPGLAIKLNSKDLKIIIETPSRETQEEWSKLLTDILVLKPFSNNGVENTGAGSLSHNIFEVRSQKREKPLNLKIKNGFISVHTQEGIEENKWHMKHIKKLKCDGRNGIFSFETSSSSPEGNKKIEFLVTQEFHRAQVSNLKEAIEREQRFLRVRRNNSDPNICEDEPTTSQRTSSGTFIRRRLNGILSNRDISPVRSTRYSSLPPSHIKPPPTPPPVTPSAAAPQKTNFLQAIKDKITSQKTSKGVCKEHPNPPQPPPLSNDDDEDYEDDYYGSNDTDNFPPSQPMPMLPPPPPLPSIKTEITYEEEYEEDIYGEYDETNEERKEETEDKSKNDEVAISRFEVEGEIYAMARK